MTTKTVDIVERTRTVKAKPQAIKIGHGYYNLKLIREIVENIPDGVKVELISHPGKQGKGGWNNNNGYESPSLEIRYPRGSIKLISGYDVKFYQIQEKYNPRTCKQEFTGKVEVCKHLTFRNFEDLPVNTFSLLAVEFPL